MFFSALRYFFRFFTSETVASTQDNVDDTSGRRGIGSYTKDSQNNKKSIFPTMEELCYKTNPNYMYLQLFSDPARFPKRAGSEKVAIWIRKSRKLYFYEYLMR
mmetsp:Transcript_23798/g.35678  ORF Transcript_23798/g.35678 Transcript_23798/m.35678 type:complete len:103 (-) Transcript_23798:26-334(-)